jgi:hypothetical protein
MAKADRKIFSIVGSEIKQMMSASERRINGSDPYHHKLQATVFTQSDNRPFRTYILCFDGRMCYADYQTREARRTAPAAVFFRPHIFAAERRN